ncbi:MAG TPA: histidine kinase [Gemmatimonadaceae bacterium]|nr:histidine kinase [Gemmatimonadaceae bacterium]
MKSVLRRGWFWYAAAWIPTAFLYSVVLMQIPNRNLAFGVALAEAFSSVAPVAFLGVAAWWLSGRVSWPPRHIWSFALIHLVAMALFIGLWLAAEVTMIAFGTGLRAAMMITRTFAVFDVFDGVFFYVVIAAVSYAIRIATRLREQDARLARADALRMRAELAALRGQLNPHFLFNTLHTLTALVRRDPDTAEHALERFGDMLRYVLDVKRSAREDVTLGDELEFLRNYLALEQLRFGDRLRVVERIDPDALDCALPSLTMQPLVENAIKYGVAPRAGGGTITIGAACAAEGVVLALDVVDDGPGARPDALDAASGVGLRAVRQRLDTRYPAQSTFSVITAPGQGFAVHLTLPAHTLSAALASSSAAAASTVGA